MYRPISRLRSKEEIGSVAWHVGGDLGFVFFSFFLSFFEISSILLSVSKQIYNLDFGARSGHSALSVENTVLEQLKGHKLGKQKHIRGEDCCDLSIQKSKRGGD
ncbi:hypothetical protein CK203_069345 [Vitis vinifera]|uniref:Uncharacterized protein n=1 Tax=Vitis vinifera TaxID=29760 RepID=A0A438C031_VITVI|nr:hypothetical protein CK203_069345 [Vitis vinifera]